MEYVIAVSKYQKYKLELETESFKITTKCSNL